MQEIEITFEKVKEYTIKIKAKSFNDAAKKLDDMFENGIKIKAKKTGRKDIRIIGHRGGWADAGN